jgi:uncharacterized protein
MADNPKELVGSLELKAESDGQKGELVYSKTSGSIIWTGAAVIEYLEKAGIENIPSPAEIEKITVSFAESGTETGTLLTFSGTPPVEPEPETATWVDLPIPEVLQEDSEKLISGAEPPIITKEKQIKIEKEKVVEKKSKLPFGSSKQEKITVSENQTVKERVYIDPTVEATGYADEGVKLATIAEEKPGVSGKNIYGTTVQPKTLADPHIYPGNGVVKKDTELFAELPGFIRRGKNWIEIIEFRQHEWTVSLSRDKGSCLLSLKPGSKGAGIPDPAELCKKAEELGYAAEMLLSEEDIKVIIENAINTETPLENVAISADQESSFEISITEDKLKALLTIKKGTGRGKPLSLKEVGNAIKTSGLKNLIFEKIKDDILEFYNSNDLQLIDYLLTQGKAPTNGPDRTIEWSLEYLNEQKAAALKQTGKEENLEGIESLAEFPLSIVQQYAFVEKEQLLATISPETPGEPGLDVYGAITAGAPGKTPDIHGFENISIKQNVIISTKRGLLEKYEKDDAIYLRVRLHQDASVQVKISDDKMTGYLTLISAEGSGKALTLENVMAEIQTAGIIKGIQEESVKDAVEKANSLGPVSDFIFAMGKHPNTGSQSRLKFHVKLASGADVVIRDDGSADFKHHDKITSVKKGDVIAEKLPPELNPQAGWDITGKEIDPQSSPDIELEAGDGVTEEVQEDKSVKYIAEESGELFYEKNRFDIRNAHVIKGNVDLKSGNVKFEGSVHITGSVNSGFYVMSGKDIGVGEGIEAALLSAEESITIKQGIKGAGKAFLRTKENISAAFAEQATMLSVKDIIIQNACIRCQIKCNGKLVLKSDKGNIVGGTVRSRMGIEAANIGSERSAHTQISFGQDYLIMDRIELEEKEVQKIKEKVIKIDTSMKKSEKEGKDKELDFFRREKLKLLKMLEKRGLRLFTMKEKFEEHFDSEIIVRGTIYPGVILESHGRTMEITTAKKAVSFAFNLEEGRIVDKALKGKDQTE